MKTKTYTNYKSFMIIKGYDWMYSIYEGKTFIGKSGTKTKCKDLVNRLLALRRMHFEWKKLKGKEV